VARSSFPDRVGVHVSHHAAHTLIIAVLATHTLTVAHPCHQVTDTCLLNKYLAPLTNACTYRASAWWSSGVLLCLSLLPTHRVLPPRREQSSASSPHLRRNITVMSGNDE
jgi:hypothetical protein